MDELLGRRVPHSPQAEQAVIGAMLVDPDCIPEVLNSAAPEHFYIQANRDIFETVLAMFSYGQTVDPVTVLEQMRQRGVWQESTHGYMASLIRDTLTTANVGDHVAILRDKAIQRELGRAAQSITDMVNEGAEPAEVMLDRAEQYIFSLRHDSSRAGLKPISEIVEKVYYTISEMAGQGEKLPGLPTGLVDLDERILGLNEGELVLVASRPGMGKSSIALNIAMNAAKASGKAVAIFSLEMAREQLALRLLSGESLVNTQKLLRGSLSSAEWKRIVAAASVISATKLYIDDNPTLTVSDMKAQCRRVNNLGLVIIDYLQLMQSAGEKSPRGENRQQIVSEISRMLKIMAKELSVPVLCLSQLSRASETRQDKRPLLSDLRESGAIEQDADVVIGLYREGYYNRECENPNTAEAIILKNRKGETGTVNLLWMPDYTTYVSVEKRRDDEY